jgi:pyruvate dehydrogenase E2 component (dihydrolipoamide acetyltransferase)
VSAEVFRLPDLGEGLTEAEIVRWLVADGDVIEIDQPVVEVETAKAVVEVPSPHAGRVAVRHALEGATLDVGAPLLTVASAGPSSSASPAGVSASAPSSSASPTTAASAAAEAYRDEERAGSGNVLVGYGTKAATSSARHRRPRRQAARAGAPAVAPRVISPIVRRLARDAGVDLSQIRGTGPGGVITRRDLPLPAEPAPGVAAGVPAPAAGIAPPTAGPVSTAGITAPTAGPAPTAGISLSSDLSGEATGGEVRIPLSGFRKAVSAVLSRSRAEIPEATVWVDVDATALWELRERTRDDASSPGLLAYIARFVTAGLRDHPVLNARLDTERQEIVQLRTINLGIATQTDRGLIVPAVLGAQAMTATQLDAAIRDVTARARRNEATPAELSAGTFTLNNYGAFRVDGSAAIINHPQVAILGLGRIIDRPWVVDGALAVRKIAQLSFVFDHRVCDGGVAAGFLRAVADAIEDPLRALARL